MSERLAGVPAAPPMPPPRDAAVVVLFRRVAGGAEVFWIEREQRLTFAGGFFAFPGGKTDTSDALVAGEERTFIVTAARELFEETGILKARGSEKLTQSTLDELRKELLEEKRSFAEILKAHALTLNADDFLPAGRWVTPPYLRGFDARFFLVEADAHHIASIWPGELAGGEWIAPAEATRRWERAEALLHPPNLHALRVMANFTTAEDAAKRLAAPPHMTNFVAERIEFQRGVMLFPMETPTLPPAAHTNSYLLGTRELVIIDPGAPDEIEENRLVAFLDSLKPEGFTVKAIVLTHHHGDHLGGAKYLAEKLNAPVWAHARTADRSPVPVSRVLNDGDVIELDGPMPMKWRVLHTPGHAQGHVVLLDEVTKSCIAGDMVAGVGTIVIDPPEGDMAEYLSQLHRLETLPVRAIYPAHGPVIPDGPGKLREYQLHRAWREQKVFDALASFKDGVELSTLVEKAYDDVASFVWPIAERNTDAIVQKLLVEGRARRDGAKLHAVS